MKLKSKIKILVSYTIPTLSYGSQTWFLTKKLTNEIRTTQRIMERNILGLRKKDKIQNTKIRKTKAMDIGYTIKKAKFKYTGHIARITGDRWVRKVIDWTPYGNKRRKGRPGVGWRDEIRNRVGLTWQRAAQNRVMWKKIGEAYAQKWAVC